MATENRGLSTLWKTEDWLAVWVGFLILILVLPGLTGGVPKFKGTTDGEFASFSAMAAPQMEKLAKSAGDKGEKEVQTQALAVKAALDKVDRKEAGDAAKKLDEAIKGAKDTGVKKKAAPFNK